MRVMAGEVGIQLTEAGTNRTALSIRVSNELSIAVYLSDAALAYFTDEAVSILENRAHSKLSEIKTLKNNLEDIKHGR